MVTLIDKVLTKYPLALSDTFIFTPPVIYEVEEVWFKETLVPGSSVPSPRASSNSTTCLLM